MCGAGAAWACTSGDLFPQSESTPTAGFWTHSSFKRRAPMRAAQLCPRHTKRHEKTPNGPRNKNESAWRHNILKRSGEPQCLTLEKHGHPIGLFITSYFERLKLKCPKPIIKYIKHTELLTYSLRFQMHPIKKDFANITWGILVNSIKLNWNGISPRHIIHS